MSTQSLLMTAPGPKLLMGGGGVKTKEILMKNIGVKDKEKTKTHINTMEGRSYMVNGRCGSGSM